MMVFYDNNSSFMTLICAMISYIITIWICTTTNDMHIHSIIKDKTISENLYRDRDIFWKRIDIYKDILDITGNDILEDIDISNNNKKEITKKIIYWANTINKNCYMLSIIGLGSEKEISKKLLIASNSLIDHTNRFIKEDIIYSSINGDVNLHYFELYYKKRDEIIKLCHMLTESMRAHCNIFMNEFSRGYNIPGFDPVVSPKEIY